MGRRIRMWKNMNSYRTLRRGVTLLEVLMSIGVVSIGLLGVVALIPVAGHEARQGVQNDAKALAGKRAFREFAVRGMADPSNWFAPGNPTFDPLASPQAFCIDPVGFRLAEIAGQNLSQVSQFPSLPTGQVRRDRCNALCTHRCGRRGRRRIFWQWMKVFGSVMICDLSCRRRS